MALVYMRICKKAPPRRADGAGSLALGLPVNDIDGERRRQVALRALQERMNKLEQHGSASSAGWPTLLDAGSSGPDVTTPEAPPSVAVDLETPRTPEERPQLVTTVLMHPAPQLSPPAESRD